MFHRTMELFFMKLLKPKARSRQVTEKPPFLESFKALKVPPEMKIRNTCMNQTYIFGVPFVVVLKGVFHGFLFEAWF